MTITAPAPAPAISAAALDHVSRANQPGAFQRARWASDVKPAAAHRGTALRKISTAVVRTGVDYANLGVNADAETGSLPWGEWAAFPYIIQHRGAEYARLYIAEGTIRTTYFVDNREVSRPEFEQYLTPSQRKPSRPNGGTITVRLENVELIP